MAENNSSLTSEEKTNLREMVANRFEEYMEYAESMGLRMTVLTEHLAEVWCWEPDMKKIKQVNKQKEVA